MGRPKALLDFHGTPLLRHMVDVALRVCPLVVVAVSPGQELPPLPPEVVVIEDPPDRVGSGPLGGVLTGLIALQQARVELAYIGAVDVPWLDETHIRFMLDELARDTKHPAIVPETGPLDDGTRHLHPLSGAVRVAVACDTTQALFASGQRAMRSLYIGLNARRVAVSALPNPQAVIGCDTPEQWEAALAALESKP
jgi:molybdopterin-guanine dinucleotide biosynthesis protein A